jgi:hypothetical protein
LSEATLPPSFNLVCPECGSVLSEDYKDDTGLQFYKCEQGHRTNKPQKRQTEKPVFQKKPDEPPKLLEHINNIEDPAVIAKPIVVEAVISSTSISYVAPSEIEAVVEEKDEDETNYLTIWPTIPLDDPINLALVAVTTETQNNRLCKFIKDVRYNAVCSIEALKRRTIYKVRVRPPVVTLEKREGKCIDEKGYEYKCLELYVVSEKELIFQPSTLIKMEGLPLPHPKTQQTTLLAYKVDFPEDEQHFNRDKLSELKGKFDRKSVVERLNWILENFEAFSHIYGRRNIAEAILLGYFTPLWVQFDGEEQRGWGNIQIVGDTTCGKSESQKKAIKLLKAGALISAETASTVGLTGTTQQIEKEGWLIDWGFLPLMDRKLLAIDGAHKLNTACWAALAEAERSGVISIAKAAKNSTYARTRQIRISNAVDREENKYATKSLACFLYPCQALTTILDKTSIARIDISVFADQRDVTPEAINQNNGKTHDPTLEALSDALKWVWSNKARVEWTEEAKNLLLEQATALYKQVFCESIPLITIDVRWKIARLSVALAYLTLSANDDYSIVTVTADHVTAVVAFLSDEYSKAGLNIIAQEGRFERLNLEDVKTLLAKIQGQLKEPLNNLSQILKFIVVQGRTTKDELKAKFSIAENNELRPLMAALQNEGLLKNSRGYYPTPKLIECYKLTDGFSIFNTCNTFNTPKKEGVGSKQENRTITNRQALITLSDFGGKGSFSDPVKHVKSVKNEAVNSPFKQVVHFAEQTYDSTRTCGQCSHHKLPSCQYPGDPETIQDDNCWAVSCRAYTTGEVAKPKSIVSPQDFPDRGAEMEGFD